MHVALGGGHLRTSAPLPLGLVQAILSTHVRAKRRLAPSQSSMRQRRRTRRHRGERDGSMELESDVVGELCGVRQHRGRGDDADVGNGSRDDAWGCWHRHHDRAGPQWRAGVVSLDGCCGQTGRHDASRHGSGDDARIGHRGRRRCRPGFQWQRGCRVQRDGHSGRRRWQRGAERSCWLQRRCRGRCACQWCGGRQRRQRGDPTDHGETRVLAGAG